MNRTSPHKTSRVTAGMLLGAGALVGLGAMVAVGPGHARPAASVALDAPVASASPALGTRLPTGAKVAAARLFDEPDRYGETRALLILKDGRPVFEHYGPGFGPDSRLISWSMAKTVTALMIGVLVSDGRLALDGSAPVPAWQRSGDPRGRITLRQLLHMASGLEHVENGEPVWESDTVRLLFGEGAGDMAGYAEAKPLVAEPGRSFVYSSATSVILSDIIARTLTPSAVPTVRRDAVLDFLAGRLTEPLGITSLTPEFDAAGTMIGGSMMHATARDYARIGEFMRLRGQTVGGRLLPDKWFDFMLAGSPADKGYGGHVWLNRPRPRGAAAALWPGEGPNDLFALLGHQGQHVIVSPGQRLTVVRLGISSDAQIDALRPLLAEMMRAL